jgi:acyl carrier protein
MLVGMTKAAMTALAADGDVIERAGQARWAGVLSGIRADALDCLQSTVAVLADDAYGIGAHLALGCEWRFPARGPDGVVGVQPSLAERLAQAGQLLGLHASQPEGPVDAARLRVLARTAPLYVVAEAYDLRWLPYAQATVRYRDMPHSFLLTAEGGGGYTVVDAYYADTEWGRARPAAWTLTTADLDQAISGQAQAVTITAAAARPPVDQAAAMTANAAAARAAGPAIDDYAATARASLPRPDTIERLILDVWHLCRERLLHAAWLGDHPAAADVSEAASHWQQLAAQSYLASRRARRGTPPGPALIDDIIRRLHADAALISSLAPAPPAVTRDVIASTVVNTLHVTLGLDTGAISPASALRSLPGFDSFRLVEVIDRAEADLGLRFPGDATAGDLADVAGLCRLFARVAEHEGRLRR